MTSLLHLAVLGPPPAFIPSPSNSGFSIGPFFFHAYGICYVFAVAAAIAITRRRWRRAGGDPEIVYNVAWWGFPADLTGREAPPGDVVDDLGIAAARRQRRRVTAIAAGTAKT